MRLFNKIFCAVVLLMPLVASAAVITLHNNAGGMFGYAFNAQSRHTVSSNSNDPVVISEETFKQNCANTPKACKLTTYIMKYDGNIFTSLNTTTFFLNSHDGVIGMVADPHSAIDVIVDRFDITYNPHV